MSSMQPIIDESLKQLRAGAVRMVSSSLQERIGIIAQCIIRVAAVAGPWMQAGCAAKQTGDLPAGRAEEILTGPVSTLRFLHLTLNTLRELQHRSLPRLPGTSCVVADQLRISVFPTRCLYDAVVFRGLTAETWLEPGVTNATAFGDRPARLRRVQRSEPRIELVLGAGNVSSIPITDALTKIFQDDCAVLLKMNPVNAYLRPIFEDALQPLIQAGWLRIIEGGGEEGSYAVQHPLVDSIHMTGSTETHDAIVWGRDADQRQRRKLNNDPLMKKLITSELGNVTPWIIVPGEYSTRQLRAQAECIVASIVNNASFNCIATKMLITWNRWPQQTEFLDLIDSILHATPTRYPYYPGAATRFAEFASEDLVADARGHLPWTLRRNTRIEETPHLFQRESFVGVAGQTSLDADSPLEFLDRAVEFVNQQMTGTLAANLTVPSAWHKRHDKELDRALVRLRYGTIGINQWAGVAFALMSTPWGAFPGATLQNVESGIGGVHNTYLLDRTQKTILRGPLCLFPKPVWYSTHACPDQVAHRLCSLYSRPSLVKLPRLFVSALRG
jgi:hypothetical protein